MKTYLSVPVVKQLTVGARLHQILLLPLLLFTLMGGLYLKELSVEVYVVGLYLFL